MPRKKETLSVQEIWEKQNTNQIIAFGSGKGGVGKTFLTISLAQELVNQGKKVLVFDGDLGLPNVDIALGLEPKTDLGDVLIKSYPLNQAISKSSGMDVIAGCSGTAALLDVSEEKLAQLMDDLKVLARHYDYVLIDLGTGLEKTVRQLVACAKKVVVVCTEELTSLVDAYAFMKMLGSIGIGGKKTAVLVNQVNAHADGKEVYETLLKTCENFLKETPRYLGSIRKDTRVREAFKKQQSIATICPDAEVVQDIKDVLKELENHA